MLFDKSRYILDAGAGQTQQVPAYDFQISSPRPALFSSLELHRPPFSRMTFELGSVPRNQANNKTPIALKGETGSYLVNGTNNSRQSPASSASSTAGNDAMGLLACATLQSGAGTFACLPYR